MKLRTGIIDDEAHCIETLRFDLQEEHADEVEIIFTASRGKEAIKQIKTLKPDLVFLDIEMPGLDGFDILELIDDVLLNVIFTTAHAEYAVKAVGSRAVAYLLKPIEAEDLKQAIGKVREDFIISNHTFSDKLAVSSIGGIELIPHSELIYCHSCDNYTELHLLSEKKIMVSKTLKHFERVLPQNQFFRIHKSYIVNLNHLKKYLKTDGGVVLMQNEVSLPVSRTNKEKLLNLIHSRI